MNCLHSSTSVLYHIQMVLTVPYLTVLYAKIDGLYPSAFTGLIFICYFRTSKQENLFMLRRRFHEVLSGHRHRRVFQTSRHGLKKNWEVNYPPPYGKRFLIWISAIPMELMPKQPEDCSAACQNLTRMTHMPWDPIIQSIGIRKRTSKKEGATIES